MLILPVPTALEADVNSLVATEASAVRIIDACLDDRSSSGPVGRWLVQIKHDASRGVGVHGHDPELYHAYAHISRMAINHHRACRSATSEREIEAAQNQLTLARATAARLLVERGFKMNKKYASALRYAEGDRAKYNHSIDTSL